MKQHQRTVNELTKYKTAYTKESVHKIQTPVDDVLEPGSTSPDDVVECPIGAGRQRNALRSYSKGHDLRTSKSKKDMFEIG